MKQTKKNWNVRRACKGRFSQEETERLERFAVNWGKYRPGLNRLDYMVNLGLTADEILGIYGTRLNGSAREDLEEKHKMPSIDRVIDLSFSRHFGNSDLLHMPDPIYDALTENEEELIEEDFLRLIDSGYLSQGYVFNKDTLDHYVRDYCLPLIDRKKIPGFLENLGERGFIQRSGNDYEVTDEGIVFQRQLKEGNERLILEGHYHEGWMPFGEEFLHPMLNLALFQFYKNGGYKIALDFVDNLEDEN